MAVQRRLRATALRRHGSRRLLRAALQKTLTAAPAEAASAGRESRPASGRERRSAVLAKGTFSGLRSRTSTCRGSNHSPRKLVNGNFQHRPTFNDQRPAGRLVVLRRRSASRACLSELRPLGVHERQLLDVNAKDRFQARQRRRERAVDLELTSAEPVPTPQSGRPASSGRDRSAPSRQQNGGSASAAPDTPDEAVACDASPDPLPARQVTQVECPRP